MRSFGAEMQMVESTCWQQQWRRLTKDLYNVKEQFQYAKVDSVQVRHSFYIHAVVPIGELPN
eukprot:4975930-Pyramimonas_sp.AAC.1